MIHNLHFFALRNSSTYGWNVNDTPHNNGWRLLRHNSKKSCLVGLRITMAYYNNRPGHHTWNVSSVTYWNPIDMVFSEQVYIIKWWSKNQVSENSVKYSWNYEALSVSLKCPINHEIKKIKISCFGNTKILTLTCFDPNMKKIKTREQG